MSPEEEPSPSPSPQKGKIRKSTQLKKWFVAKMCEYSRGRKLIHKLTGNVGVEVIDAVQSLVLRHSGRDVADDMILQLYKVICKAGVLIMEKEITDEMMRPSKNPNILLMHCLIEQLEEPVATRDASVLFGLMEECFQPIVTLLSRFEGSAKARLMKMRSFIVSTDIVEFFLSSEEATAEREVILRNMRAVMLPYQAEVVQVARVVRSKLQGRRLELIRLLTRPTVVDFLRNARTFAVLCDWFAVNRDAEAIHWLYFYKSAREYSAVSSRCLMSQRASQIQQKYLQRGRGLEEQGLEGALGGTCRCPVNLPSDVHQRVMDSIEMDEFSHGLFTEALAHTVSVLRDDFAVIIQEKDLFAFLREELEEVESKLRALTRQEHQQTESSRGVITSTQNLLLPDALMCSLGDDNEGEGRSDLDVEASGKDDSGRKKRERGMDKANVTESNTVERLSFWN